MFGSCKYWLAKFLARVPLLRVGHFFERERKDPLATFIFFTIIQLIAKNIRQ